MTVEFQAGILEHATVMYGLTVTDPTMWVVRLFQQVGTITETNTLSTLTEANYAGYAAQNFAPAVPTFDTPNDRAVLANAVAMVWTVTGSGPTNNITGIGICWGTIIDPTIGECLVYIPISPSLVMGTIGDTFSFTPTIYYKHGD